jgi:RNA polymerase sigma-70 factor (ECF subfamily)
LEGFRAGERRALTEVYRLHAKDIARMLSRGFSFSTRGQHHRFVGYASAFELQDALHETFRLAFEPRARQGYDGIRPYGPYLRTIARNVVLKSFRAREKLFPSVDDQAVASTAGVTISEAPPSPERHAHDAQVRGLVEEFLQTLPEADRELVRVRFSEGLSQRDAAERLGLGRQRIRTRELKLRKQLLVFLRARGEEGLVTNGMLLPVPLLAFSRVGSALRGVLR